MNKTNKILNISQNILILSEKNKKRTPPSLGGKWYDCNGTQEKNSPWCVWCLFFQSGSKWATKSTHWPPITAGKRQK